MENCRWSRGICLTRWGIGFMSGPDSRQTTAAMAELLSKDLSSCQMKVPAGLSYILGDLFAQGIDCWEFYFVPESLQEADFNFGFRRQVDGMEIQQMRFDREKLVAECGAVADVGDGIETLGGDARPGNINAIFGHEFFVAREIDRRHGIFRAVAAPAAGRAQNAERA